MQLDWRPCKCRGRFDVPLGARDRLVDAVTPDGIVTDTSDNIDWGKVSKWRDAQPSPETKMRDCNLSPHAEGRVSAIADAIFDTMSLSDGVEKEVAERYARAAIAAMVYDYSLDPSSTNSELGQRLRLVFEQLWQPHLLNIAEEGVSCRYSVEAVDQWTMMEVVLHSYDTGLNHEHFKMIEGKRVRVTVDVLDGSSAASTSPEDALRKAAAEVIRCRHDPYGNFAAAIHDLEAALDQSPNFRTAILEEAAQVAENFDLNGLLADALPKGWKGCRRAIAAAIRSISDNPSPQSKLEG